MQFFKNSDLLLYCLLMILMGSLSCSQPVRIEETTNCKAKLDLSNAEVASLFNSIYSFHKPRMEHAVKENRLSPELYDLYSDGLLALYIGKETRNTKVLDQLIDLVNFTILNTESKNVLDIPMGGFAITKTSTKDFRAWTTTTTNSKYGTITHENLLHTTLHAFLIANITAELSTDAQYAKRYKNDLVIYADFLNESLSRWVYKFPSTQFNGWGCTRELFSFETAILAKSKRGIGSKSSKSYCNGITDQDILVAGATTIFTSSTTLNALKTLGFKEETNTLQTLKKYCSVANQEILGRINFPNLTKKITGFQFDSKSWVDHPDWSVDSKGEASQDISHSRRIFHLLLVYKRNQITMLPIDINHALKSFGNQLYYKAYNRNSTNPLFSNYLSGANSVYRLHYRGTSDSGVKKYGLSYTIFATGYLGLENINPEYKSIRKTILNSPQALDTYRLCPKGKIPAISITRARFYFEATRYLFPERMN